MGCECNWYFPLHPSWKWDSTISKYCVLQSMNILSIWESKCVYKAAALRKSGTKGISSRTVTGRRRIAIKQFKWRTRSSPAANPCMSFKRLCQKITDSDASHRNFYPSCPISSRSLSTVLTCPSLPLSLFSFSRSRWQELCTLLQMCIRCEFTP